MALPIAIIATSDAAATIAATIAKIEVNVACVGRPSPFELSGVKEVPQHCPALPAALWIQRDAGFTIHDYGVTSRASIQPVYANYHNDHRYTQNAKYQETEE